ncbi:MAG: glycosyltransferase [Minisyncoccota bacterium]
MTYPEISVILPCYKEADVITTNILIVARYLTAHFDRYEIIVVVDGSPDHTHQIVKKLQKEHAEIPLVLITFPVNQGKGSAVKAGVLASQYDPILFLDADLTIAITELGRFLTALDTSDMVIASRLIGGSKFHEPISWYRIIFARGFYLLQALILNNVRYPDTQCGFKLFRRETALALFSKITVQRFAFDAELIFLARRLHTRITTLPVTILRDLRNTNVSILRDPINMFFALLKIRLNDWRGKYN